MRIPLKRKLKSLTLDQVTPHWPVLEVDLTALTITTGRHDRDGLAITGHTKLLADDPQQEAVEFAAAIARSNGRAIRMNCGGQHLIVSMDGRVTKVEPPARKVVKPRKWWQRFPKPARYAGATLGVLTVLAVVVLLTTGHRADAVAATTDNGTTTTAPTAASVDAPAGWSQDPAWTADITGTVTYGPAITTIDGAQVVLVTTTDTITYWPVSGGTQTDIPLPNGASVDASGDPVWVNYPWRRVGYLQDGRLVPWTSKDQPPPAAAATGNGMLWVVRDGHLYALQPAK